jgi:PadR family transcriptional regulator, regulatory protein AphA
MEYILKQIGDRKYIDCLENSPIEDERAALDVVAICSEEDTDRVMLHSANLPDSFFKLSTGLAGNVLQKFYNYSILAAAVLTPEQVNQGKFYDFALETNRGNQFRIFFSRQEAEEWLTRD